MVRTRAGLRHELLSDSVWSGWRRSSSASARSECDVTLTAAVSAITMAATAFARIDAMASWAPGSEAAKCDIYAEDERRC